MVFIGSWRLSLGLLLGFAPTLSVCRFDLHLDLFELLQVLHLSLVESHHVLEAWVALEKVLELFALIILLRDSFFTFWGGLILLVDFDWFACTFPTSWSLDWDFLGRKTLSRNWELRNRGILLAEECLSWSLFSSWWRVSSEASLLNNLHGLIWFKPFYSLAITFGERLKRWELIGACLDCHFSFLKYFHDIGIVSTILGIWARYNSFNVNLSATPHRPEASNGATCRGNTHWCLSSVHCRCVSDGTIEFVDGLSNYVLHFVRWSRAVCVVVPRKKVPREVSRGNGSKIVVQTCSCTLNYTCNNWFLNCWHHGVNIRIWRWLKGPSSRKASCILWASSLPSTATSRRASSTLRCMSFH